MQAPIMTPEMMMQQGGGQAPMQEQAPAQVTPDEIAEAKRMLGLDVLEESMKYDKSLATVLQEYPELTKAAIEKELAKMEEKDPSIAKQIRSSEVGMMMFAKGIISGWMIATLVWIIPSVEDAKIWLIVMITYLMALGDFTHIVVGSAEVSYLVWAGELSWHEFWIGFAGPTLAGNIIGGSCIFALISHAQIRSESSLPGKVAADPRHPQRINKDQ